MTRTVRRLAFGLASVVLIVVAVDSIETYTMNRRIEEDLRRTSPIRTGMTETEVRTVAGEPDELLDLGSASDVFGTASGCQEAKGIAAMLYSVERRGWISDLLGLSSGISTTVVCLDERRVVVKMYLEMIQF